MPIQFLSKTFSETFQKEKDGFHFLFLLEPNDKNLEYFYKQIQTKIPCSYDLQKKEIKKQSWSSSCSPQSQIFYFPKSILYLYYYDIQNIRCSKIKPSQYTQWKSCIEHFLHSLPNMNHPIYIHLPKFLEDDKNNENDKNSEDNENFTIGLWNSIFNFCRKKNSKELIEFWNKTNLFICSSLFKNKKEINQHFFYGQFFTLRNELAYIIELNPSLKNNETLSHYYSKNLLNRKDWYFPSYCSISNKKKYLPTFGSYSTHILNEKELKKENCNLILAVNQGSKYKSYMHCITYMSDFYKKNKRNGKPFLLVGKGVTYDTGGMSLKSDKYLLSMETDMAGSALSFIFLKFVQYMYPEKYNFIKYHEIQAVIPICENIIDGKSLKVGQIIMSRSKIPVAIMNTDAEGRLILADAISYGFDKYKPEYIMDVATLTGEAETITNKNMNIVCIKNMDSKKIENWKQIMKEKEEPILQFPYYGEYETMMRKKDGTLLNIRYDQKSDIIQSIGFIGNFIPNDMKWIHMDLSQMIQGNLENDTYFASGSGLLSILELIKQLD